MDGADSSRPCRGGRGHCWEGVLPLFVVWGSRSGRDADQGPPLLHRVRGQAEPIALLGAEVPERKALDHRLEQAFENKVRLVGRRWLLALVTKALE